MLPDTFDSPLAIRLVVEVDGPPTPGGVVAMASPQAQVAATNRYLDAMRTAVT